MTSTKLVLMLAVLASAGGALARDMPRLPAALALPQSSDSPGVVTFNHDMHVDTAKPDCVSCHPRHFGILGRSATKKVAAITHASMEKGGACGACHGKKAFSFDDCSMCHKM